MYLRRFLGTLTTWGSPDAIGRAYLDSALFRKDVLVHLGRAQTCFFLA